MEGKLAAILPGLRRRFEVLYGERVVRMLLFGSQAWGDAEPVSDIDVLVVCVLSLDQQAGGAGGPRTEQA